MRAINRRSGYRSVYDEITKRAAEASEFIVSAATARWSLPGVGKVTEEKLAKLQIETVGELRSLDLSALEHHFGRYGVRLHELARGIDDSEVVPERPTQSISVEDTFEQDVPLSEIETNDPAPGRKALECFAHGITGSAHGRAQIEDKRVQDSHSQPLRPTRLPVHAKN
jgi:hypothetical protein